MSIFRMCCERNKSTEDLNQTDELYDKTKSNLNSELEDGGLVQAKVIINFYYIFKYLLIYFIYLLQKSSTVDSFIKVSQFKRDDQQVDEANLQVVEEVLVPKVLFFFSYIFMYGSNYFISYRKPTPLIPLSE